MKKNDLYTKKEVSKKLDITLRTIDRYIQKGVLKKVVKNKRVFVTKDSVKNLTQEILSPSYVENISTEIPISDGDKKLEIKKENHVPALYFALMQDIKSKDDKIEKLSYEVGKLEEQVKNSVPKDEINKKYSMYTEQLDLLKTSLNKYKTENAKFKIKIIIYLIIILIFFFLIPVLLLGK